MSFTPKAWEDSPSTATPLSAAAMIDLEERLAAYAEGGTVRTTLPGSPTAGDTILFQTAAMAALSPPVMWKLRYNGTVWLPVGGATALTSNVGDAAEPGESTTSTSYADIATVGPSVAIPAAGAYQVRHGGRLLPSANAGTRVFMSYAVPGGAAADADAVEVMNYNAGSPNHAASVARSKLKTGLIAGTLTAKYRVTGNTGYFGSRWLEVTPVSLG